MEVGNEIQDHFDGHGLTDSMRIEHDEIGPGGAHHDYRIVDRDTGAVYATIQFQKGPRKDAASRHGCLDGALLAVVLDRYRGFQAGPFSSRQGALVITKIEEALGWMKNRADERARRGVLGTNVK